MTVTTIKLSPKEALIIWKIIDGALDAGACEDGLTENENNALEKASDQLIKQLEIAGLVGKRKPKP